MLLVRRDFYAQLHARMQAHNRTHTYTHAHTHTHTHVRNSPLIEWLAIVVSIPREIHCQNVFLHTHTHAHTHTQQMASLIHTQYISDLYCGRRRVIAMCLYDHSCPYMPVRVDNFNNVRG